MRKEIELSQQDTELMAKYHIEKETRTVFHSGGYQYDKLEHAVRYAKIALEKKQSSDE